MIQSAEEFVRLRLSDKSEEYRRSANEEAPEEVWLEVISGYPELRRWVAHSKKISPTIMKRLAEFPDVEIAWALASKRKCPASLLLRFAKHPDESVRNAVAMNKKTPASILALLAGDEWETCARNAQANLKSKANR